MAFQQGSQQSGGSTVIRGPTLSSVWGMNFGGLVRPWEKTPGPGSDIVFTRSDIVYPAREREF
jgi:hypothetical protein